MQQCVMCTAYNDASTKACTECGSIYLIAASADPVYGLFWQWNRYVPTEPFYSGAHYVFSSQAQVLDVVEQSEQSSPTSAVLWVGAFHRRQLNSTEITMVGWRQLIWQGDHYELSREQGPLTIHVEYSEVDHSEY